MSLSHSPLHLLPVFFGLLAAAVLLADAAPTNAGKQAPQHIPLSTVRLPEEALDRLASPLERLHAAFQEKTTGGNAGLAYTPSNNLIVGTVSVGSPAQSVQVWISQLDSGFIFLNAYGPDSTGLTTTDAQPGRYDYTASTSAVTNNQNFSALQGTALGNITITDTIQFNNVSVAGLTFGDATAYVSIWAEVGLAGVIGLSPNGNSHETNLTSFGSQLATSSAVDTPVVSLSFVLSSLNTSTGDMTSSGQVTVGAEEGTACTAGTYTYVTNTGPYATSFRVDSISGQTPSGDPLSLTVNANRSTMIYPMDPAFYGSNDLIQLLVNASGLTSQGNSYYEAASCDDVQNMGSLTLNLAGGSTLTLSAADYIFQNVTSDGTTKCGAMLISTGLDETDSDSSSIPISLGQFFLNNHCYTHNYADGTIGIASAVTQTTMVVSAQ